MLLGIALAVTLIFVISFVDIAHTKELLLSIPDVGQCQALRVSACFALFVAIVLWEQRRW